MKKRKSLSFFDREKRQEKVQQKKDVLIELNARISWESFRRTIEQCFPVTDPKKGGRPPFDRVMMFKILILQTLYNLSDDQMEFQILDRMSFGRFLGINLEDDVPDAKTIWLFRDQLTQHGVLDKLFDEFYRRLADHQLILNTGRIIDASIVEAPRPRTKKPDGNSEEPANPNSERQQDTDADWTKKHGKSYFGYKNHIKVDRKSKLIIDFQTTPASVHDSQVIEELIAEADKGQTVYADSGYFGEPVDKSLKEKNVKPRIQKRATRGNQLTEEEKERNSQLAKIRCRVEHVFGFMRTNLKLGRLRYRGLARATTAISLMNLVYNMWRGLFLTRQTPALVL